MRRGKQQIVYTPPLAPFRSRAAALAHMWTSLCCKPLPTLLFTEGVSSQHGRGGARAFVKGPLAVCATPAHTLCTRVLAGYWNKVLEWRRKYPGVLVGMITLCSLLPGLSRKLSPRVLLRNSVIGGGVACVLLYPELVMRTAPYVVKKASQLEQHVEQRVSR